MNRIARWLQGALLAALMAWGIGVSAHPIGAGPGVGLATDMGLFCGDQTPVRVCNISQPIAAVPGAGVWEKRFPNLQGVNLITLEEDLTVGQPGEPGLNWTDWHEVIISPGWVWGGGAFTVGDVNFGGVPSGGAIDFEGFDLEPGTEVHIRKNLVCVIPQDQGGCTSLVIHEWPTTAAPEPASLALLLLGLAGLGFARRAAKR